MFPFLRRKPADWLDDVLYRWTKRDALTVRDCLRSIEVKGLTGSGKSSGSGDTLLGAILAHPRSTVVTISQKPTDKEHVEAIFTRHKKPLITFEESGRWRCNYLETEQKAGADTRALVEFLTTLGEALDGGKERTGDPFWKKLEERILYAGIEGLRQGQGAVSAPDLLRFLSSAAIRPEQIGDATWQQGFHNQTMRRAWGRQKSPIEAMDNDLIKEFWYSEYPSMDEKPRSSGMAGVMNVLHTANTGLVRELTSTTTNFTPAVVDEGVSILIHFPYSVYGPTGRYIAGGLKYMLQRHVLRRPPGRYFNVLMMDEYQESATEFDARYLSLCRSQLGCMFCLTQTIASEYAVMSGAGHHHRADQLLSNFGLHIYHTVDPKTAKFAAELLGMRRERFVSVTPKADPSVADALFGTDAGWNMSESYQYVLQPSAFTSGLRSGGKSGLVDAIVIKLGEPFSTGENFHFHTFRQQ